MQSQSVASAEQEAPARALYYPPIDPSVAASLDPAFVRFYNEHIKKFSCSSVASPAHLRQAYHELWRQAESQRDNSLVGPYWAEDWVPGWQMYVNRNGRSDILIKILNPGGLLPGKDRQQLPVHFNFHSGGWVAGDLETDAKISGHIAAVAKCCVIDIAYRLAPEFPFPTGIIDSFLAVRHVLNDPEKYMIDPNNFSLGGSDSGATIALALAHLLRDARVPGLKAVVAVSPLIRSTSTIVPPEESIFPSMSRFQDAPVRSLTQNKIMDNYVSMTSRCSFQDMSELNYLEDLLLATDMNNLGPYTLIATAEVDPRRDEAETYARAMQLNWNHCDLRRYTGMPHNFLYFDAILRPAHDCITTIISVIRDRLSLAPAPPQGGQMQQFQQPWMHAGPPLNVPFNSGMVPSPANYAHQSRGRPAVGPMPSSVHYPPPSHGGHIMQPVPLPVSNAPMNTTAPAYNGTTGPFPLHYSHLNQGASTADSAYYSASNAAGSLTPSPVLNTTTRPTSAFYSPPDQHVSALQNSSSLVNNVMATMAAPGQFGQGLVKESSDMYGAMPPGPAQSIPIRGVKRVAPNDFSRPSKRRTAMDPVVSPVYEPEQLPTNHEPRSADASEQLPIEVSEDPQEDLFGYPTDVSEPDFS